MEEQIVEREQWNWYCRYTPVRKKVSCTLVFLHGFLGTADDWDEIISCLPPDVQCIAVDLPGHGRTTGNVRSIQWESVVRELGQLIQQLVQRSVIVVGYSMGGRLALGIAAMFPTLVRGLVLESASPGIEGAVERLERYGHDLEIALDLAIKDFEEFLQHWYAQPLFSSLRSHPQFRHLLDRRFRTNDPLQLSFVLRGLSVGVQPSYWQWLTQPPMPVQFVVGEQDPKYVEIARRIQQRTGSSVQVCYVTNAGHTVHFEQPQRFCSILKRCIDNWEVRSTNRS